MTVHRRLSTRRRVRTLVLVALVLLAAVGVSTAEVAAQSGTEPSVTLTNANVNVQASQSTNDVTGTYTFRVQSVGSGEQRLTALTGIIWSFPGRGVSDFTARVDGQRVDATTTRDGEVVRVSIPAANVRDGDTVRVRVSYSTTNADGALKVPMFVPDYSTPGGASVVDVKTTLPQGMQTQGDVFPTVQTSNGNVVTFGLLHVPGFVYMTYGNGGGSILTTSNVMTVVGLLIIVGFLGAFFKYDRGMARGDAE